MTAPDIAPGAKHAGTENFPVGSFLIRAELRPHIHAFYNFARAADDIADNPLLEASQKVAALQNYARVIEDGGDAALPAAQAMRDDLRATGVTPAHCLDLLAAFRRDATQLRYRDWDDLLDYCRYSAAPVGRQVLALHDTGDSAWPANDALCAALQILNHLQDCADDYRELDRVYLPQDMLAARGAHIGMLAAEASTPELRLALDDMLDKLAPLLVAARDLPRQVPDLRLKLETAVICSLADAMAAKLRRCDPLAERTKLSKAAALWASLRGLLRAFM